MLGKSALTTIDGRHQLSSIAHGEETLITRRGKVVAKIVPVNTTDLEAAKAAAVRLRALAKEINVSPAVWASLLKNGRRV
jgi:antitoxin (DNA-binding transcriptional repressor) of toxin-antitoxin stability system